MGTDDERFGEFGPGETENESAVPLKNWKIRFDAPPGEELSRRVEGGDILSLFRAWDATRQPFEPHLVVQGGLRETDRRESARYVPVETTAWVGWWQGGRFSVTPIVLVNLSRGGALVVMGRRPPSCQPVWLCLGAPHPTEYVQARVLDASPHAATDDYRVRLDFHMPCPPGFFFAAGHKAAAP